LVCALRGGPTFSEPAWSLSIEVTKSVTPTTTLPTRSVLYTVVFDNSGGIADVDLNTITDTFNSSLVRHAGAAYGSEIDCPHRSSGAGKL